MLHGLWRPVFFVGFLDYGAWDTRHPSIGGILGLCCLPCPFLGLLVWVLWIFRLSGLRILWRIGHLPVWCCPWSWFYLLGFVFLLLGWILVSWSSSGFSLQFHFCVGCIWLHEAMLYHMPSVHPGRWCICLPLFVISLIACFSTMRWLAVELPAFPPASLLYGFYF